MHLSTHDYVWRLYCVAKVLCKESLLQNVWVLLYVCFSTVFFSSHTLIYLSIDPYLLIDLLAYLFLKPLPTYLLLVPINLTYMLTLLTNLIIIVTYWPYY
jgi:hypothetical protein